MRKKGIMLRMEGKRGKVGKAKVGELDEGERRVEEKVLELEVAVAEAQLVDVEHGMRHLRKDHLDGLEVGGRQNRQCELLMWCGWNLMRVVVNFILLKL